VVYCACIKLASNGNIVLLHSPRFGALESTICNLVLQAPPIPVTVRSKAWVCDHSLAETVGSNPADGMDVCCECCVLSGRGLCDEPITRPEESYRV
jgi:hypothetical protein